MLGSIVLTSSARTTFRFREVYHPESTYLESRQQPSSRASTLLAGYFPYL